MKVIDSQSMEKLRARQRMYRVRHRDKASTWHKSYWTEGRKMLIEYMGGKCEVCGFADFCALQIDHANGGGGEERKRLPALKRPQKYMEHIKKHRADYQLLCANCNWIKKYEKDENRKREIAERTQEEVMESLF